MLNQLLSAPRCKIPTEADYYHWIVLMPRKTEKCEFQRANAPIDFLAKGDVTMSWLAV